VIRTAVPANEVSFQTIIHISHLLMWYGGVFMQDFWKGVFTKVYSLKHEMCRIRDHCLANVELVISRGVWVPWNFSLQKLNLVAILKVI